MKLDKSKIKRILFISLSNIGDIVLTTPVIHVLAEHFPDVRLDVMVGPAGEELFRRHPAVFKVVVYNKRVSFKEKRRLIRKLRKVRYDLIVDMRNSLFPFLLGARYRTSPIQNIPRHVKHKKQQHLWKLQSLGISVEDAPFYLNIPKEDTVFAQRTMEKLDRTRPIIAVSPGAKSEIKRWTKKGYTELIDRLTGELGAQVIIVGDKIDKALVKEMVLAIKNEVMDLSGKTTLCQLAAILKNSHLLITNDSAPMHMGVAVGTKVLAIFGPTDPHLYGPAGNNDRVLKKKLHCSPCEKAQCEFEHECMKYITADDVFKAAAEMLGK